MWAPQGLQEAKNGTSDMINIILEGSGGPSIYF